MDFFTSLGVPAPSLNAYMVSSLECFGGLFLIIGLASRPLALATSMTSLPDSGFRSGQQYLQ
jgi:putative oxidoreductase